MVPIQRIEANGFRGRRSVKFRLFTIAIVAMPIAPVFAQQADGREEVIEEIVVTGIQPDRPGIKPILSWEGSSESTYDIYYSDNLQSWNRLDTVAGVDGRNVYQDRGANWEGVTRRYYKIMLQSSSRGISSDKPIKLEIRCEHIPEE